MPDVSAHCPGQIQLAHDMIEQIRKVYLEYFKASFDKLGLVEYETLDGLGMGALIKFKNDYFRLQIINGKGILDIEISPPIEDEHYRQIELFNSLLQIESKRNLSALARRTVLTKRLDYSEQANFLLENEESLKRLLDKKNFNDTLKRIDALGEERFGFPFK